MLYTKWTENSQSNEYSIVGCTITKLDISFANKKVLKLQIFI